MIAALQAPAHTGGVASPEADGPDAEHELAEQVDAVIQAAQVLIAVTARSVADAEENVTLPQLRVLVMIAGRGPLNLNALAKGLGVHASNATRACDRLVAAGLLERRESDVDRRNLRIDLTADGRRLVTSIARQRRRAVEGIVAQMAAGRRRALAPALRAFADAAGAVPRSEAWTLGWPSADAEV
jgi:DNA-binding MarR family transcriptional regulator